MTRNPQRLPAPGQWETDKITTEDATITREFNPTQTESLHFLDSPAPASEYWEENTSGSGSGASPKDGTLLFGTGSTQGSIGEMWLAPGEDASTTPPSEISDWSKDRVWRCYVSTTSVNEIVKFGMGLLRQNEQWIGFVFDGGSLYTASEDGNTRNRTEIDSNPATGAYDFEMRFVSGSRVEYYIDGVKQTEHTANLPSGDSRSHFLFSGRARNPNSTDARGGYERTEVVIGA